ncbi:hypothetical protein sphantq_02982 [Sphingobium sp. AntQ-1]|uniref:hypothetical protein n=1 Tax=Sphingobium sp. AntQ-1 TaxID=2930091 RepID=UPI00234F60E2|nr:hypothetical protein [Sphingobium sp. AntQ-1]WCP14536.1 hypothetical protein sphantq_02982 [Sphingobium sp. AntQ-1]
MSDSQTPAQDLRSALEPFASWAQRNVDDSGWNDDGVTGCRERIVDWFGPSQFRAVMEAYAALAQPAENAKAGEVEGLERAVKMAHETMAIGDDGSDAHLHRAHVHAAWVVKLASLSPAAHADVREALVHDDDCEAMLRPRADCTCIPQLRSTPAAALDEGEG